MTESDFLHFPFIGFLCRTKATLQLVGGQLHGVDVDISFMPLREVVWVSLAQF